MLSYILNDMIWQHRAISRYYNVSPKLLYCVLVFRTYSPHGLYSTAVLYNIYSNHYVHLTMALCGRNKSVNLRERMAEMVILPIIWKAALSTRVCTYTVTIIKFCRTLRH
jgi:hypothetical protein